ncbi:MAG: hypothetical protein A2020_02660 [Lentisphaerae bacterium GWF2_45_14]|nr:MAG: hypothetical protein A2020_02660 [Lentisphaerae bacterium GWF2_45_14]
MKISKYYESYGTGLASAGASLLKSVKTQDAEKSPLPKNTLDVINNVDCDVFQAVDDFLYLNKSDRLGSFFNLKGEGKEKFFQILAKLLKEGIIGYEKLELKDGTVEKHFIETEIGNRRLKGAKYYDESAEANLYRPYSS